MLGTLWTLNARLREPDWDGWWLTNHKRNPEVAAVWKPSGMGFTASVIEVADPLANFPYGLAVDPP